MRSSPLWFALAGCLGPVAETLAPQASDILPAGTQVPSVEDVPALAAQLDGADGVGTRIVRDTAFAAGHPVHAWDFGPAPAFAAPLLLIMQRDATGALQRVPGHPTIIAAMPGDPGYSPYWEAYFVEITPAYAGERLTSVAAVQEAVERGLVLTPVVQPFAINCPATASHVRLEVGNGMPDLPPTSQFYYRGMTVPYYDFGPMPIGADGSIAVSARYVLRREGQEPLSEPTRGIDMTGDGDIEDTNDIYDRPGDPLAASPHAQTVDVAVPATIQAIDSFRDETRSDLTNATQLFAPQATANVVAVHASDEMHDRPLQRTPGAL